MIPASRNSLFKASGAVGGQQNFTTYTSTGAEIVLTSATTITATMTNPTTSYAYKDFGAGYWSDSLTMDYTFNASAFSGESPRAGTFGLSNTLGNLAAAAPADGLYVLVTGSFNVQLLLWERSGGISYTATAYTVSTGTPYYCRVYINRSLGTYGTAYLYIYTDAARTVLVNTQTLTLHSVINYRYILPVQGWANVGAYSVTFTINDMTVSQ